MRARREVGAARKPTAKAGANGDSGRAELVPTHHMTCWTSAGAECAVNKGAYSTFMGGYVSCRLVYVHDKENTDLSNE